MSEMITVPVRATRPPLSGLHIKTIKGDEFDVFGEVTSKVFDNGRKVYYCGGQSWPEVIVVRVYGA